MFRSSYCITPFESLVVNFVFFVLKLQNREGKVVLSHASAAFKTEFHDYVDASILVNQSFNWHDIFYVPFTLAFIYKLPHSIGMFVKAWICLLHNYYFYCAFTHKNYYFQYLYAAGGLNGMGSIVMTFGDL